MRKTLLKGVAAGALLAALAAAPAMAADLPEAPIYVPPPVPTWTGFYIGIHGGGAWINDDSDHKRKHHRYWDEAWNGEYDSYYDWDWDGRKREDDDDTSWLFGAQAGYNWQTGNFVFGLEADIAWMDYKRRFRRDHGWSSYSWNDSSQVETELGYGYGETSVKVETDWLATIRGRAGLTYDRWLLYVTGGAAVTQLDVKFRDDGGYYGVDGSWRDGWRSRGSDDETLWGWTVGAGIEGMITPNLTAKLEYLYINFSEDDFKFDTDWGHSHRHDIDVDAHVIRAGLNYKFDW